MQEVKPSGKGSFLRSILRALGIDAHAQDTALQLPSRIDTRPSISLCYSNYISAMREAEEAKAIAIMEIQRRQFT